MDISIWINDIFDTESFCVPFPLFLHLQVHLNKLECRGKVHLFQYFNSNCETRVLNKFNAHRLK